MNAGDLVVVRVDEGVRLHLGALTNRDTALIGIVSPDDLPHAAANLLDGLGRIAARRPHIEEKRRS